jgi:UDPglucose--hexose-1-phosphate uridylyltransferase
VVCFSPRHDLTLPELDPASLENVVATWQAEYRELGAHDFIRHVQIFENKGELMGCSNPHPHGQIWAQASVPDIPAKEDRRQKAYRDEHGRLLLHDYLEAELRDGERVVTENDHFATVVPFWALWPFEAMIIPKAAQPDIGCLNAAQVSAFAEILRSTTARYDNLFTTSFPYSAGIHQRPTDGADYTHWCWHMHFYPPLLRSAQIKKFMVGYEMLAEPQRDITPEHSAALLRELPAEHYSKKLIIAATKK